MLNRSVAGRGLFAGLARGFAPGLVMVRAKLGGIHLAVLAGRTQGLATQGIQRSLGQLDVRRLQEKTVEVASVAQTWLMSNPSKCVDVMALALVLWVALFVISIDIGWGDYGQWLMLSRFYSGQEIPDYRGVTAVPPTMPMALAALRIFVHDPIAALDVFRFFLLVGFAASFYLAGSAIFRTRGAGMLSAVFALTVTDRLLEPFAFGGMPQLMSLTFLGLGVAAFAHAGNREEFRMRWWVVGSLGIGLSAFSHAGTGSIAIISGVMVAAVSVARLGFVSWTERGRAIAPFVIVLGVLAIYWIAVILPANQGYTQNAACGAYRGPDRLWALIDSYMPNVFVLRAGVVLGVAGLVYDSWRKRLGGYAVVLAWVLGPCLLLSFSILTGQATDYPRFCSPLIAPLAVAAGGSVALIAGRTVVLFREQYHEAMRLAVPVLVAAIVAISMAPRTTAEYRAETLFYQAPQLADLIEVANSLDAGLPQGASILTSTGEGKWFEGLTGRAALFSLPTRFSFREVEKTRTVAADTIMRSTTSLTNEHFFIKYVERKVGLEMTVPRQPWFSVNHGGEYVDLLRMLPTETKVISGDASGGVLATLNALEPTVAEVVERGDSLEYRTVSEGARRGGWVTYTSTLLLPRDSTSIYLLEEVQSTVPVDEIQMEIRPVAGMEIASMIVNEGCVDLAFTATSIGQPRLRIASVGQEVWFERTEKGIVVHSLSGGRMHLRVTADTAGPPIFELGYFDPQQLVTDYNIQAVLLRDGSSLEPRMARLALLGFQKDEDMSVGEYVVLRREVAGA